MSERMTYKYKREQMYSIQYFEGIPGVCWFFFFVESLHSRLLALSGRGEADPPHAVRAVHRVPGASFGAAAQQQCGASRGGGAARLHPGSHQTAGILLQVLRVLSCSPSAPDIASTRCVHIPAICFLSFLLLHSLQSQCQHAGHLRPPDPHPNGPEHVSTQHGPGRSRI